MRFGRNFYRCQAPEWASSYVDYNGFKRRIKHAFGRGENAERVRQLGIKFNDEISCTVDIVDRFYRQKYTAIRSRIDFYGAILDHSSMVDWTNIDSKEVQYLFSIVDELRKDLKKLYDFGKLNSNAIRLIVWKLHRSVQEDNESNPNIVDKTFHQALFYNHQDCQKDLKHLETFIAAISQISHKTQPSSTCYSLLLENLVIEDTALSRSALSRSINVCLAIREDDSSTLDQYLGALFPTLTTSDSTLRSLFSLLSQMSILWNSSSCLEKLLSWVKSGPNGTIHSDIFTNLLIIEIVERIGRERSSPGTQNKNSGIVNCTQDDVAALSFLEDVLDRLTPEREQILYSSDSFDRLALHYAALYGYVEVCQALLSKMCGLVKSQNAYKSPILLPDSAGDAPLELAVYGGHAETVKILLDFHNAINGNAKMADQERLETMLADLFIFALKSNYSRIVNLLLSAGADVNYPGNSRETALYVAANSGKLDNVNLLLAHGAHVDTFKTASGWTPLFVAAAEGYVTLVNTLLDAGASQHDFDSMSWTALDHAAYRGHIKVVKILREHAENNSTPLTSKNSYHRPISRRREQQLSPINESRILVHLGSFNFIRDIVAVNLQDYSDISNLTISPEAEFSIEVSALGSTSSNHSTRLPVPKDVTVQRWIFTAVNPSKVKLCFRIYDTITDQFIGSGIAIIGELQKGLGQTRESLIREYSIPVLRKESLDYIGTVTFNLLVITPFEHVARTFPARDSLWKEIGSTRVVGHRGRGMNVSAHKTLQIGENSLQSFLSAFKLGAAWVELDVQVTKNNVPVVYHDFLVSETGTDTWIHNLNLNQLMHISNAQLQPLKSRAERTMGLRPRSHSLGNGEDHRITDLNEKLKNTYEYRFKKFKANTRGDYIHEPFITLDELLTKLPESYPLNIEIKYPMLSEAQDQFKADIFCTEINLFVDTILSHIFNQPRNYKRPIMFSSFSPEICLTVSLKQDTYPIFFLTDSGNWPTDDVRTSSLQEAVHFARRWNLDGIVTASEPLVWAPKLVGHVKNKGFVIASYGKLNNDPISAKIQADAGLDIIIVDNVRPIIETLNGTRDISSGTVQTDN